MDDNGRKYLEFIQAVITRMANNSFLVRGWSVTLVSALFALAAKDADRAFVTVSYFPCLLFWALDAYYLSQERKFRSLFDLVRKKSTFDFDMDTSKAGSDKTTWGSAYFSKTMLLFHGAIIVAISIVMFVFRR